jgi:hypothetical protein
MPGVAKRDPSSPCRLKRRCTYEKSAQVGSCSRDPIGYEGSPWNLYEFNFSAPTDWVDPSGLAPCSRVCARSTVACRSCCRRHPNSSACQGKPCLLAIALMEHWYLGHGGLFTGYSDSLKGDSNVRTSARSALLAIVSKACNSLDPGESTSGTDRSMNRPQPAAHCLIQTTNVPSRGLEMFTRYSATKTCHCCIVKFDTSYRWRDRADMHPDKHWPDSWIWWTGTEFDIDVTWRESSTYQIPNGEGGCEVRGSGWPFPIRDPSSCARCN